jgi:hypothetical protein
MEKLQPDFFVSNCHKYEHTRITDNGVEDTGPDFESLFTSLANHLAETAYQPLRTALGTSTSIWRSYSLISSYQIVTSMNHPPSSNAFKGEPHTRITDNGVEDTGPDFESLFTSLANHYGEATA